MKKAVSLLVSILLVFSSIPLYFSAEESLPLPNNTKEVWGFETQTMGNWTVESNTGLSSLAPPSVGAPISKAEIISGKVNGGKQALQLTLPADPGTTGPVFDFSNDSMLTGMNRNWTDATELMMYVDASAWEGQAAGPNVGFLLIANGAIFVTSDVAGSAMLQDETGEWKAGELVGSAWDQGAPHIGLLKLPAGYRGFVKFKLDQFWVGLDRVAQTADTDITKFYNRIDTIRITLENPCGTALPLTVDALSVDTPKAVVVPKNLKPIYDFDKPTVGEMLTGTFGLTDLAGPASRPSVQKVEIIEGTTTGGKEMAITLPASEKTTGPVFSSAVEGSLLTKNWMGSSELYLYVDATAWKGEEAGPNLGFVIIADQGATYVTSTLPGSAYLQDEDGEWVETGTVKCDWDVMGAAKIPAGYKGFVKFAMDKFWFNLGMMPQSPANSIMNYYHRVDVVRITLEDPTAKGLTVKVNSLSLDTEPEPETVYENKEIWGFEELPSGNWAVGSNGLADLAGPAAGPSIPKVEIIPGNVGGGKQALKISMPQNTGTTGPVFDFSADNTGMNRDWTGAEYLTLYVDATAWQGKTVGPNVGFLLLYQGGVTIFATSETAGSALIEDGTGGWMEAETTSCKWNAVGAAKIPAGYKGYVKFKLDQFWFSTDRVAQTASTSIKNFYGTLDIMRLTVEDPTAEGLDLIVDSMGIDIPSESGMILDGKKDNAYHDGNMFKMESSGRQLAVTMPNGATNASNTVFPAGSDPTMVNNWSGAQELLFHVDASDWVGETAGPNVGFLLIPGLVFVTPDVDGTYYIEDGKGGWKAAEHTRGAWDAGERMGVVKIPAGYVGRVRVVLSKMWYTFTETEWYNDSIMNYLSSVNTINIVTEDPTGKGHTIFLDSFSISKSSPPQDADIKEVLGFEGLNTGELSAGVTSGSWNGPAGTSVIASGGTNAPKSPYQMAEVNTNSAVSSTYYHWDEEFVYIYSEVTQNSVLTAKDQLNLYFDLDTDQNPSTDWKVNFSAEGQSELGIIIKGDGSLSWYGDKMKDAEAVTFTGQNGSLGRFGVEIKIPRIKGQNRMLFGVELLNNDGNGGQKQIFSSSATTDPTDWTKAIIAKFRRLVDGTKADIYSEDRYITLDYTYKENPNHVDAKIYYYYDEDYVYLYCIATKDTKPDNNDFFALWIKPDVSNIVPRGMIYELAQSNLYNDFGARVYGTGNLNFFGAAAKNTALKNSGWVGFSNDDSYGMELCFERPKGEIGFSVVAYLESEAEGNMIKGTDPNGSNGGYNAGEVVYYDESSSIWNKLREANWKQGMTNLKNGVNADNSVAWSGIYTGETFEKPVKDPGDKDDVVVPEPETPENPETESDLLALIKLCIEESGDNVLISLTEDNCVLTPEMLELLKQCGKPVQLQIYDPTKTELLVVWMFGSITDASNAFDPRLNVSSDYDGDIRALAGNKKNQIVSFAHKGLLPGKATVLVPNHTGFTVEELLKLHWFNPETGKLEALGIDVNVSNDGIWIALRLEETGGDFVVIKENIPEVNKEQKEFPWLLTGLIAGGATVLIGATVLVIVLVGRKKTKKTTE